MDRRSCRECVEQELRNLDGLRICQDVIEKRERRLNRKRIYRGSVEKLSSLKKGSFSREEKHIKMNATSKLLNQRSNQYIKLLRHRSIYKHSIHRSKNTHTHTHTLNKSNQFYISKNKSRQFSKHILTHVFLVMAKSHCTCTWPNHIVHAHVSKVVKNFACCV